MEAATAARKHIMVQLGNIPRDLGLAFSQGAKQSSDAMNGIGTSAKLIGKQVAAEARAAAKEQGAAARAAAAVARQADREKTASARAAAKAEASAAKEAAKEKKSAARDAANEQKRLDREVATNAAYQYRMLLALKRGQHAEEQRAANRAAQEAARLARQQGRELDRFATRTSHRATRFFWPNMPVASMARRGASEVVRGLGVDPTISGALQRNVQLESTAVEATNSARLAGQEIDPMAFAARVREVSGKRGMSRDDAASGLLVWQKKTGDLSMGMELLDKMAERSAATSTKIEDFAGAMASASTSLGDMPNKGKVLLDIMDAITVQGARGAVEVSDLATHFSRIAATSGTFGGDQPTLMKKLGALAQISMGQGGSPSAAEAVRSITGFGNTFRKSARLKQFEAITGGSAFTDGGNTTLKDPITLIKEALVGTKGDLNQMNKIFMDVIGGRAVTGFTKEFNQAGGGEKGLAAVDAMLAKFMDNASLTQELLNKALAARDKTTEVKVQKFQNKLDDIAQAAGEKLLPALEKAEPAILKFVEVFGNFVAWAAENPWKAVMAALSVSVGRALLESSFRAAIERAIIGAIGGGRGAVPIPLPGGGGPGGPVMVPPAGRGGAPMPGGKLAVGLGTAANALMFGYMGYQAGGAIAGERGADMGAGIGGGAQIGGAIAGPLGAALGAAIGGAVGSIKHDLQELYAVTDGFKSDEDMNREAREKAREREKKRREEFVPPKHGERVTYQADPGETMDSFRKRVKNRDPSLKVLRREDLPDPNADKDAAMRAALGLAPGGKSGDPMFDTMSKIGGYGADGAAQKTQAAQSAAFLGEFQKMDAQLKDLNRNVESLRTSTLNVRDVTPRFDGVDEGARG
jgi:hypothetical protein